MFRCREKRKKIVSILQRKLQKDLKILRDSLEKTLV